MMNLVKSNLNKEFLSMKNLEKNKKHLNKKWQLSRFKFLGSIDKRSNKKSKMRLLPKSRLSGERNKKSRFPSWNKSKTKLPP